MNNQEQHNINISLDKTTAIECPNCSSQIFSEGLLLRKVSRFLSGTPQDGIIPISVMYCVNCKKAIEETLPAQLKN